ncbi:hypothetical protein QEN19_002657 [Hanseniaspora menglaensis]
MTDEILEIKLPELPPLSSFSRRSANARKANIIESRVEESFSSFEIKKNETKDIKISSHVKDENLIEAKEKEYEMENDVSLQNEQLTFIDNNTVKMHDIEEDETTENYEINFEQESEDAIIINETTIPYIAENDIHKRFMNDAENTLSKLNLQDLSENEMFNETIPSRVNKVLSVKSSVTVFNSRPIPPGNEELILKDSSQNFYRKRRPNMLVSRKNQDQVLSGATILPPRTESSVSIMENSTFFNKSKYNNNRIKTVDLLEDLKQFHYTKPNNILSQNREVSIGSNLTSLSSPISGDLEYFNNNSNYLDFIQNNGHETRISSHNNASTPTTNLNSNQNNSSSYQFQSRAASSSYRSENRNTSVSSYSGSKPLFQVPSVSIPTCPFQIEYLTEEQISDCKNIFSMNEIYEWLLKIYFEWFSNYLFDKMTFFQLIQLLIEFNIANKYNEDFINQNVDQIIESLLRQRAIKFEKGISQDFLDNANDFSVNSINYDEEELTIITPGLEISGVLTNLVNCYCCDRFVKDSPYKCCSFICSKYGIVNKEKEDTKASINQKLINSSETNGTIGLWFDYWNLSEQEILNIPTLELKKQSFIFDLIMLEEKSINIANAAIQIYGKRFYKQLLPNDPNFENYAFHIFEQMSVLHKTYILDPLYEKIKTDGKFINSIGEIYLRWVDKATKLYLEYTECMGTVNEILNWEKSQPISMFREWIKEVEDSPEIKMSKLYHDVIFFGGFFKSLQNLPVTLNSILKCTSENHDDYDFITIALEEIIALNNAVDKLLGTSLDRAHVLRISRQLIITKSFKNKLEPLSNNQRKDVVAAINNSDLSEKLILRLNEKQRKLLNEGELIRKRDTYVPSTKSSHTRVYLFLFDNFLLITEKLVQKGQYMFKLLERPIPIDYLNLESKIGVSSSWEFKIRNIATNESFSFVASSPENLVSWTDSISLMLQKFSNNKEESLIFKLRCVNDSFTYKDKDALQNLTIPTLNSALDHALKQVYNGSYDAEDDLNEEQSLYDEFFSSTDVINTIPIVFEGRKYTIISTTLGIYVKNNKKKSKIHKLGDWKFVCKTGPIQKIELCPMINFLMILNTKGHLYYISLQSVILSYYNSETFLLDENLKSVVGILINDKVSSFFIAEDLESSLQICYQRKGNIICHIPEYDFFSNGIRAFKYHKTYKLSSSSLLYSTGNGINFYTMENRYLATAFKESFIVSNPGKGFILYNTAFNSNGIELPNFPDILIEPHVLDDESEKASSLERLSKEKLLLSRVQEILKHKATPIRSFMLQTNKNLILVYSNTVILMDNNGVVSNGVKDILMIDFIIKTCEMHGDYLILCGENLVQVYDLNQELLVERFMFGLSPLQIIKGKKMKLVSSDSSSKIMLLMSHPLIFGKQLILELVKV